MYRNLLSIIVLLLFETHTIYSSCKKTDVPEEPYASKAYIIQLSTNPAPVLPQNFNDISRYNFYGITWNGKVDDNLKFAKQMGYSYVMYKHDMENSSLAKDFFFYLESPDYQVYYTLDVGRTLVITKAYTASQINTYKTYFALKDTVSVFPNNMATGWFSKGNFSVEPDWQQQKVIDYFVTKVMEYAHSKEKPGNNFLYGGLAWDVPNVTGDFWLNGRQTTLAGWTGKDSCVLVKGNTHEYNTYSGGKAAYYIAIVQAQKAEFPGRVLNTIYEPFRPYEYLKDIEKLPFSTQSKLLENVFLSQECGKNAGLTGTEFVDDARLYVSGLITKNRVGSSTPDNHDLTNNLNIATKAAINGAWFNWYGRFSGSGDRALIRNIYEVPNWLQLIRVVANWDNLNGIPLTKRSLISQTYTSTNSRMDNNVIYSRQPKTQKLFVVFLNNSGEITLNPGEKVISIKRVDSYFCETVDGNEDLLLDGNIIKLKQ